MAKTVVITARIDEQLSADLDRLAAMRDRSRAWLIEKAVAEFVREQLEFDDSIAAAEADFERGDYRTHDEFMAELKAEFAKRHAA